MSPTNPTEAFAQLLEAIRLVSGRLDKHVEKSDALHDKLVDRIMKLEIAEARAKGALFVFSVLGSCLGGFLTALAIHFVTRKP